MMLLFHFIQIYQGGHMKSFKLLLVLPDLENEKILTYQSNNLPIYFDLVDENIGFDNPQPYNDYFYEITGIPLYRRYSFNSSEYVVFVFEQIKKTAPKIHFCWKTYDEFLSNCDNEEKRHIINAINKNYKLSINMPWLSKGFSPYFLWLDYYLNKNNIILTGQMEQLKNAYVSTVFCVPTNIGNLYLKIPGEVFIGEIVLTSELRKSKLINLPNWLTFDSKLNAILMTDMGGYDLPYQSKINIYQDVIAAYTKIQKNSINHLPLKCHHYDSTINTTLEKLKSFSQKVFAILKDTKYELSEDEFQSLQVNIMKAEVLLKIVNELSIPNTIHHGDLRPGNIRVIDDKYMFYDWAWGGVSHPFVEITAFLHIVRRNLDKEIIIEQYLKEWIEFGTYEELKNIYCIIDNLKNLFFAIIDYDWIEAIISKIKYVDLMSADGWLLERRTFYLANVIRRFINTELKL